MWIILLIIASIALIVFFKKSSNAVWGGATIGLLIGIILVIIMAVLGKGFSWSLIYKPFVIGVLVGLAAELLGIISKAVKGG